jgi:tetratricopeptide (TPR) repeat protein
VGREDLKTTKQRNQLRETLHNQGRTREQIAAAMARRFGDRPRPAWRHACGWTQDQVAALFNEMVSDPRASMTGNRISDFERWPISRGPKPTVRTLRLLAILYGTKVSNLIDSHDRQKLDTGDLLALSTVDFVIIPHQLPSTISDFVGRTHELDILNRQLDPTIGDGGMVVITSIGGTAGIGKTTLALYWSRTHIDQFPDGQLYVDLRGFSPSGSPVTSQEAVRGFLDAFQIPAEKIPPSFDGQVALYRTLVEDRRLVIVLDNARDDDQVLPLLPGSPSCMVLVTSRQQLPALLAHRQAIHIALDLMTTTEARQLLINSLGVERIEAEPEAVDELIRYCVGLPIALNIAAARIRLDSHLPLSTLVAQLREHRQRLDALTTGRSQLTDIRAVFSWSYTALSPQSARLFRLLGLHPGPDINTLAAASLAGLPEYDTGKLLTELTQAYLIKQHSPGRYQFHDLLRVYAAEQASIEDAKPHQQEALHRALDYYLHTGVAADRHLDPHRKPLTLEPTQRVTAGQISDYQQAMEWFTAEHNVLLAAINYAATHGFDTHAWKLPWILATFLSLRGHRHDQAATQQIALAAANRLGDRTAQAASHGGLGYAHLQLGHYTDASAHFQQALTLYQELGDRNGQTQVYHALSLVCERQGSYTEALAHTQHALDLSHATGNRIGEARALNDLGWYHAQLDDHQQAITCCQQALNLQRELNDRWGEAATLDSLGYAHHHLGQHEQAINDYQQALALLRELGDHYHEAEILTHVGDTYHATGDDAAAREAWQQALTILDDLGHSDADILRTKLETLAPNPDTDAGTDDQ